MNLLTAKTKTKKLIDEYSTRGNINTDSDLNIVDYSLKMNDYFDIAQKRGRHDKAHTTGGTNYSRLA